MSRLTRREMKRDEVREALSRGLLFVKENAKRIAIGLAVLVAAIAAVTLVTGSLGGRRERASDALAAALEVRSAPLSSELSPGVTSVGPVFANEGERQAEARRRFEEVAEQFPSSEAARVARSYIASLELEAGRPEAAREIWEDLASAGQDDALAVQIVLNLLELERAAGEAVRAEERLLAMVDDPESPLPQARVLYELAVTQEALGKVEEARSTYQRILDEHPTSPYARTAAERAASPAGAA